MNEILQLEKERARSTSLISYYLKSGPNTSNSLIMKELNASENIKDKSTKKSVKSALLSIHGHLKGLHQIPENGLAIFAGNGHYV